MSTSTALMTAEELMQLPDDGFRYQLINGEPEKMPLLGIPHGRVVARLLARLAQFVWDHELGEVFATVGFKLTVDPDTVLAPNLAFITRKRLESATETEGYWQGPPDLAVEVLSPGKVNQNPARWLSFGTKQVWIVDPKQSTIMVYRSPSDITTFSGSDYLEAQDLLPGFRISLDRIFGPTPGTVKDSTLSQEQ